MTADDAPRGLSALRLCGRLVSSPYAGSLYRAQLGIMPLYGALEFAALAACEIPNDTPILLSPTQRYQLLTQLVVDARRCIPGLRFIGVQLGGPDFQVQLPGELLRDDVLLTHDPDALLPRMDRYGGVLTISHQLRTDGVESGDNRLVLTLHGIAELAAFLAYLRTCPVLAHLGPRVIEPAGEPTEAQAALLAYTADLGTLAARMPATANGAW